MVAIVETECQSWCSHGTESAQIADFNSCSSALLMGIWRNPRWFALAHGEPQSAHRHCLRLSYHHTLLCSAIVSQYRKHRYRYGTGRLAAATMKATSLWCVRAWQTSQASCQKDLICVLYIHIWPTALPKKALWQSPAFFKPVFFCYERGLFMTII